MINSYNNLLLRSHEITSILVQDKFQSLVAEEMINSYNNLLLRSHEILLQYLSRTNFGTCSRGDD